MTSNEINRLIRSYGMSENLHSQQQRQIVQIEQFSEIATDMRQSEESELAELKLKLPVLLVEQLTIQVKENFATYSEKQRLEKLPHEINDLLGDVQRMELRLSIPFEDILALIQKDLPELKSSFDAYTPEEHEYSLEELKVALNIHNDMSQGRSFESAFNCNLNDNSSIDLYRKLVA